MTLHVETPPGACICPTCARLRELEPLERWLRSHWHGVLAYGSRESKLAYLESVNSQWEYDLDHPPHDAHVRDFNSYRQAWPPVQVKKSDWWFMKWLGR